MTGRAGSVADACEQFSNSSPATRTLQTCRRIELLSTHHAAQFSLQQFILALFSVSVLHTNNGAMQLRSRQGSTKLSFL